MKKGNPEEKPVKKLMMTRPGILYQRNPQFVDEDGFPGICERRQNYRKRLVIGFLPYTLVFVKLRCNNWRHRMYSLFQIVCSVIAFRSFKNE
ncbi:hypothetical protein Y032_0174g435 [Ancylostoma ceylanicum]|uniref:Uncharacterized protein n=1 Tax=Ancylostoma ceylanicum TaxID=53326 RepID=A0A016SUW2_9BILA|nr:hypothetical protein Y032_0174g435 [Ancylostoma ceylanicum]